MHFKLTNIVFSGIVVLFFLSCSNLFTKSVIEYDLILFPSPPDTARIQYLTKFSSSDDVVKKRSSFATFVLGEDESKAIRKPYGVQIKNDKMYICDSDIGGLEIIDLKNESFDFFIPDGYGKLKLPINCFVDDNENLFISDVNRKQIVVFDKEGNYLNAFGEAENFKPTDVFVLNDTIYVANSINNQINVYDFKTYEQLYSFPKTENEEAGHLYTPTNLFVTENKIYVSDFGDFKIKSYKHDGTYINSVGSYGRNIGQFVRPKGIAVDREENLYVVDAGFENVQVFNKDGQLLMFFGGPYQGPGYMYLPAKVTIDYNNLEYFRKYVDSKFDLKYIILVANQFGPDKISVYGYVEYKDEVE